MNPQKLQQADARAVKDMTLTKGWEIIERDLTTQAEQLMAKLLEATDLYELRSLQAEVKAIKLLINRVVSYIAIET